MLDALGARASTTGVNVTPLSALETTPVWAAVRMIAGTVATLPFPVYRDKDGGKERAKDHPVHALLNERPNPETSAFSFREALMASALLYGNAYAEIERDGAGKPLALWLIPPYNVSTQRIGKDKVYVVQVNGQAVPLSPDDVLHVPGFSLDGCNGLVPVSLAREAIGLSKATETYGASFFGNGAQPSGVLSHPAKLPAEGAAKLRESWRALYGGLTNAQRIAVLEEGMTWTPLGIPPEHAQFLETRKFQVAEIARLFLIPPHMIGDLENGVSYASIEQQAIGYVTHTIEPWTRRIESEVNYKLFTTRTHRAEFVLEGLLRGDSKTRSEFYASALNNGWLSVNEVRALENRNAVEGGDTFRAPLNMAPVGAQPVPSDEAL